jgi:hypothetical protein
MKHKVITTVQGQKVVVDESATIKENSYWLNLDDNSVNKSDIWKLANNAPSCKKIIYTINFSLDKDIPLVIVEDEVERLANEYSKSFIDARGTEEVDFIEGYKAAQEKGVYSESDLREVVKMVLEDAKKSVIWSETYHNPLSDRIIPLLKQEYIQLETEKDTTDKAWYNTIMCRRIIKTNRVDGQLMAYQK